MVRVSSDVRIPEELHDKSNLIAGRWVNAASGAKFAVRSPVTGAVLAEVPRCGAEDVDAAVAAAKAAWPAWRGMPVFKRAEVILRMADLIRERAEGIAEVLCVEQGKPYAGEGLPEVLETALNFQLAAEDVVRMETPVIPMRDPAKRVLTFREPYGVMAVITPWNFPTVIPSEYLGPGLAAGNTVIMKPASTTPLSMILVGRCIQEALDEAGLPPGVFNLITGPGAAVGDYLVAHPDVALIGFTGETVTGEAICSRAGIKMTLMELGGNGPVIVCADANLVEAAKAAAFGCFYNAGQVCCATERILVDKKVHGEFLALLLEEAKAYSPGDPLDEATSMGPLNNEPTAVKTEQHLADARAKGAKILLGGARESGELRPRRAGGRGPDPAPGRPHHAGPGPVRRPGMDRAAACRSPDGVRLGVRAGDPVHPVGRSGAGGGADVRVAADRARVGGRGAARGPAGRGADPAA